MDEWMDEADAGVEERETIMQIKVSTGGIVMVVVPPEIERTATLPLPLTAAFDKLSVASTRKRLS